MEVSYSQGESVSCKIIAVRENELMTLHLQLNHSADDNTIYCYIEDLVLELSDPVNDLVRLANSELKSDKFIFIACAQLGFVYYREQIKYIITNKGQFEWKEVLEYCGIDCKVDNEGLVIG